MILETIEQQYKLLSKQQKLVADYILRNPKKVINFTSKDLANKSGVSTATAVRFAQQLGLENFSELKIKIASQLSSGKAPVETVIEKDDSTKVMSEKLEQVYASTVQKSFSMLDDKKLNKAVSLINNSNNIHILGVGTSGLVAYDLYHKFNRYGMPTYYETDPHMNLEFLTNADKNDVVLAISYSGKTEEVNIGSEYAKKHGVPVISITREDSPLEKFSDICLCVPDNERTVRVAAIASKLSTMYITDLLFMSLVQLNYGKMKDSARRTNNIISKLKYD